MSELNRALLVVDDDAGIRKQLRWAFDEYSVQLAQDRADAVATHVKKQAPVVVLDLGLPPDTDGPSEGLQALQDILSRAPHTKVIVITGQREREYALKAVSLGAYDYYQKPIDLDELTLIVKRAYKLAELEAENRALQTRGSGEVDGIVTCNPAMQTVCRQITQFAKADLSTLIVGESGTGKELLAHGLHVLSGRAETGQYVGLNCAAIPENLLESELFGYEKGAFTGAHKTTVGKIEQANKGTLLLDEIGDLSPALQAKLLRVLQERTFERVGGRRSIPFDARVVSATNRDLEAMVADGTFREDLYYRLGEAIIRVPPLRERPDDIVLIAQHFLRKWAEAQHLTARYFTPAALAALGAYDWPGNVRELQSRIKRAAVTAEGKITPADLGLEPPGAVQGAESLKATRARAEREAVERALAQAQGNISEAARLLDVSRPTLYQLLREHGLR